MNKLLRISLLTLGVLCCLLTYGQYHSDIQEYNNKLLINPSFAGTTFGKRIFGTFVANRSSNTASYTRILSADFYIQKPKMGLGITGGVRNNGGQNTFSMFGEGTLSKFFKLRGYRYIIPSINLGFEQPFTDFGYYFASKLTGSSTGVDGNAPEPTRVALKSGLIYANYDWNVGISGALGWQFNLEENLLPNEEVKVRFVAHWMKTISYRFRGLLSKHYYIQPRLIVDYSTDRMNVFSDFRFQHFRWNGGIAVLFNVESQKSRLAASAGYDFKHFWLNYMISGQIPSSGYFEIMQSLNLRVIIPDLNKKKFPVFPLIRDI